MVTHVPFVLSLGDHNTTRLVLLASPFYRSCNGGLKGFENEQADQVQRLTLVIPVLWEAKAGGSPEGRSLRSAWPTW